MSAPLRPIGPLTAAGVGPAERATPTGRDCSPETLAILLARVAERVRTDPAANFAHCAVRGAAEVLRARLDERMPVSPGAPTRGTSPGRSIDA